MESTQENIAANVENRVQAAIAMVRATADTIRDQSPAPASAIYLAMQMKGYDYWDYQAVVAVLIKAKLIKQLNHQLIWTGPPLQESSHAC